MAVGMVKLPVVEKDPPHSISIVSGSVISGFTWRRLRKEIAGARLDAPSPALWNSAAGTAECNKSAASESRAATIGLVENHSAGALDLVDRHRAFNGRRIKLAVLVRGLFLRVLDCLFFGQLQFVECSF